MLLNMILCMVRGKNHWSQCGKEGSEKLKSARALFAAMKVKLEVVMNAMIRRTAIRFKKFVDLAYFFL